MNEHEQAIHLLKLCLEDWPYAATRVPTIMHRIQDAISLLKEQEPRVMTLEDVVSAECVWIEYAVSGNVVIAFPWNIDLTDDTYNFICNPNCIVEFRDLYGGEWRCWTSRPTDEQRRAVKWE